MGNWLGVYRNMHRRAEGRGRKHTRQQPRMTLVHLISAALYGAETWALRALRRSEEKRIEAFEMWIWRWMERVKWGDKVRNETVLWMKNERC
ncbi:hypothetical protein ANN_22109 [Periplaneta americana]|uniref:Uncharacterized protein n=1 Tax=Periplaneta americana TaxID=6978 RepID=A0ABQ8S7S3_PERAM|nr:hypothetical protein ANN_22109 [Periplaneta americana]